MVAIASTTLAWFAVGALLLGLGYLVRVRQWTFLVAGYDDTVGVPQDVAASVVGNFVLRVGVAALLVGGVATVADSTAVAGAVLAIIVLDLLRVRYRMHSYDPPHATTS